MWPGGHKLQVFTLIIKCLNLKALTLIGTSYSRVAILSSFYLCNLRTPQLKTSQFWLLSLINSLNWHMYHSLYSKRLSVHIHFHQVWAKYRPTKSLIRHKDLLSFILLLKWTCFWYQKGLFCWLKLSKDVSLMCQGVTNGPFTTRHQLDWVQISHVLLHNITSSPTNQTWTTPLFSKPQSNLINVCDPSTVCEPIVQRMWPLRI